jgi:hypothetical protein
VPSLNETTETPLMDLQTPSSITVASSAVHLNLSSISYWHSSEAKKLFHPKGNELLALDAVKNQIKLLLRAISSPD